MTAGFLAGYQAGNWMETAFAAPAAAAPTPTQRTLGPELCAHTGPVPNPRSRRSRLCSAICPADGSPPNRRNCTCRELSAGQWRWDGNRPRRLWPALKPAPRPGSPFSGPFPQLSLLRQLSMCADLPVYLPPHPPPIPSNLNRRLNANTPDCSGQRAAPPIRPSSQSAWGFLDRGIFLTPYLGACRLLPLFRRVFW